jgi:hypothetical protein
MTDEVEHERRGRGRVRLEQLVAGIENMAIAEFGSSLYAVTYGGSSPTPDFVVRLSK